MPDRLDRYRAKRDPGGTPEPFAPPHDGREDPLARRLFVVQKHAARRLHWDFRLELDGTLRSWAVPKGPSYDPADKRMAVEVEDHPVEYADFEGVIPEGNYGAGEVIVWDRGWWRPHSDPREGLARGKLVFDLAGHKLRGEWTLVRTRRAQGGKQQWLLLKHRDALAGPRELPQESVFTGRLVEEVAPVDRRGEAAIEEARRLGAARLRRGADLARGRPMHATAARALPSGAGWLFELAHGGYRAVAARNGGRPSIRYPGGADATALWPEVATALALLPADATLDGELVVLGEDGLPSVAALEERARLGRAPEIAAAAVGAPAALFASDLLAVGGLDLRPLPLRDRKRLLAGLVPRLGPLRLVEHVEGRGQALLEEVQARRLPGVVAKRVAAPWRPGRSGDWREVRAGTPADRRVHAAPAPARAPERAERRVEVTNRDKVFFPEDGITKGDVVAYYREIAPYLLPWLRDRPVVLTRYPDGIHGKSFFQKDAPRWRPAWIRTVRIENEDGRPLDHFLVDDAEGLAWIANLGVVPIHVQASRAGALDRPDWCVVDLDPKEAPFADVVRLALALRDLCDDLGLPSHVKTSGQQGLHVLVPLGGQLESAQARTLGELLARAVEREHPDIATTARAVGARGGRVYLDFMQNGAGKTIAAPYAVRPRPGAPVSTPLRWSEVGESLDSGELHDPDHPGARPQARRRPGASGPLGGAGPRDRPRAASRPGRRRGGALPH